MKKIKKIKKTSNAMMKYEKREQFDFFSCAVILLLLLLSQYFM